MTIDKGEQIKQWNVAAFAAFNDGTNVDDFVALFAPEFTNFYLDSSLLIEGRIDQQSLQALYDTGMKPNLQLRHFAVQLYEDFAVCTGYVVGTVTLATGAVLQGPWRFSSVVVPHADSWQTVHNHWSPLRP
ncbi:MAG: nuclear transport factor 2 family protein [Caldilineaceae bacterium]